METVPIRETDNPSSQKTKTVQGCNPYGIWLSYPLKKKFSSCIYFVRGEDKLRKLNPNQNKKYLLDIANFHLFLSYITEF